MQSNSTLKKFTQTSEEALPPVYVPLTINNDCYVVTQQDFRKIEDSRLISLSKLMENGDLQPLNCLAYENLLQFLKLNLFLDTQSCQNRRKLIELMELISLINVKTDGQNPYLQQPHYQCQAYPQPMEISSCPNIRQVASVKQQLSWDTFNNTSAPFPMTYSQGTSCTEIDATCLSGKTQQNIQTCCSCCCCLSCRQGTNAKSVTFSKGTYTQDLLNVSEKQDLVNVCEKPIESLGAREQLKQKKLSCDFSWLT